MESVKRGVKISPTPWSWRPNLDETLMAADGNPVIALDYDDDITARLAGDRELIVAAPQLLNLLRQVEWAAEDEVYGSLCPICGMPKDKVHSLDCQLGHLLDRLGREP